MKRFLLWILMVIFYSHQLSLQYGQFKLPG